jgi:hypothetical protein
MFRNILDALLDDKATHVVNVAVQLGVLLWAAAFRGGLKPILAVNLVISITVLLYNATQWPAAIQYREYPLIGLNLFELAVLIASAGALYGLRIPSWLVWIAFLVNFLLCMALMLFVLAFSMTRMM